MAGYIGSKASVVSSGAERKKVFDITTTTTSLTGLSYTPNQVHMFHNGVRLVDGTDYTATNGTSITLTTAAENGDQVVVISYATFQPADTYSKSETYNKTEADNRFVNVTGDTMTGPLVMDTAYQNGLRILRDFNVQNSVAAQAIQFGAKLGSTPVYPIELLGVVDTDGTAFAVEIRQDTNLHFKIDAAGRVTMPYQPAFVAFMSANHTTTASGQLPFDSLSSEIPSQRSTGYSTANRRFTAPVTGLYQFSVSLDFAGNYSNYYFWCGINGGGRYRDFLENVDILANGGVYSTFSIHMTAGDYIQLHSGAAGINLYGGNAAYNCVWQGHFLS